RTISSPRGCRACAPTSRIVPTRRPGSTSATSSVGSTVGSSATTSLFYRRGGDRMRTAGGLLAGLRVLDLSVWRPGPYATQLLAEIGADVLKIEPPGGDPMRAYPELFAGMSANKRSIVLNLKDDADRQRALHLAAEADVVIEGFR